MYKSISKILIAIFTLIILFLAYLSFFGIKTQRFNNIIEEKIIKHVKFSVIEFQEIFIKFNPNTLSLVISTENPNIFLKDKEFKLYKISSNISIRQFLKNNILIENLTIESKVNKIDNLINILRFYENNFQTMILDKFIEDGNLKFVANINFHKNGHIKDDYLVKGQISDLNVELINKNKIITDLDFKFVKDKITISNSSYKYKNIKFNSNTIIIEDKKKEYKIFGDFNFKKTNVNIFEILPIFKKYKNIIKNENSEISSINKFALKINKKFKIKELNYEAKINIDKVKIENKNEYLKNIFAINDDLILKQNSITLSFLGIPNKNKKTNYFKIMSSGQYGSNDKFDKYEIFLEKKNFLTNIKTKLNIEKNLLILKILDFKKKSDKISFLETNHLITENNTHIIKKINFQSSENSIVIEDIELSKENKISRFKELKVNLVNDNNIKNYFKISNKNNLYLISGDIIDGSSILNQILDSSQSNKLKLIEKFNSSLKINIKIFYIDKNNFLINLKGPILYKNNEINYADLNAKFSNNQDITLKIRTNKFDERITNLYTKYPKPLIKRYKFIKGFEEGVLDLQSIKKKNISNTIIIIDNFKVKEVPIFAKLLTLASLQGIADLLTGEGIRFTDFELRFSKKNELTEISEMYAIGPAVSVLMDGYLVKDQITSLRGTLVPATTINRTISSIPLIGDILVGKKIGEGVFGVSFKIKGPPKKLKTTVNPIKTLTPRFITRTLEKLKN